MKPTTPGRNGVKPQKTLSDILAHLKSMADPSQLGGMARFGICVERNFVKKAVNWVLRQIGKRNLRLNRAAIQAAEQIRKDQFGQRALDRGRRLAGAAERGSAEAFVEVARTQESHEKEVAIHSTPSFAVATARWLAKRKRRNRWVGIELRKHAIGPPTRSD